MSLRNETIMTESFLFVRLSIFLLSEAKIFCSSNESNVTCMCDDPKRSGWSFILQIKSIEIWSIMSDFVQRKEWKRTIYISGWINDKSTWNSMFDCIIDINYKFIYFCPYIHSMESSVSSCRFHHRPTVYFAVIGMKNIFIKPHFLPFNEKILKWSILFQSKLNRLTRIQRRTLCFLLFIFSYDYALRFDRFHCLLHCNKFILFPFSSFFSLCRFEDDH